MHSDDFDNQASSPESGASDEEHVHRSNSSIVSLHSGDEQETSPSQYRKKMSRKFEAEREDEEAQGEGGEEDQEQEQEDEESAEYGSGSSKDLMFA